MIPEPNGQLTFRVFTDRAPYNGTVVTVPLSLSNDQCSLSATEAVITESNWDTGFVVTVTAHADWLLPTTVVNLDAAVAADTYYDGWDSLENVVVTVMDRRIVQPFIARNWDNTYWETESNNTMEQADGPIPHGTYIRGRLPWGDERDYYRFEVITPKTIVAILSEIPSGRNYDLILRDSEGNTRVEEGWYVPSRAMLMSA
ncbi:MAG: hypothetical protein ACP5G7_06520 [Anaerolineae bacterium]